MDGMMPCVIAGEGGSMPDPGEACLAVSAADLSGTETALAGSGFGSSTAFDFGCGGVRNGWEKNASKSNLSLASRFNKLWSRCANSGDVPLGILGASFAFFS